MKYIIPPGWKTDPQGLHNAAAERTATCVILAGGPSLRTQNLQPLYSTKGLRIITINDSWRLLDSAYIPDVCYFCDNQWWQKQLAMNPRSRDNSKSFHDLIYKANWITGAAGFENHPQVRSIKLTKELGLELDPKGVAHGHNSGYQAINLAYHFGAKRIVLLGYDMKLSKDGRTHWHDNSTISPETFRMELEKSFLPHFKTMKAALKKAGVEVINATPDSALDAFPRLSGPDALKAALEL